MEQIVQSMCNAIIVILTAVSQFDITKINPNKLAMLGQVVADAGRVIYIGIALIVKLLGRI